MPRPSASVSHQSMPGPRVDCLDVGEPFWDAVELLLDVGGRHHQPAAVVLQERLPDVVPRGECRLSASQRSLASGGTDPRWLRGAGRPFSSGAGVVEHGMHRLPQKTAGWNLRPARSKSSVDSRVASSRRRSQPSWTDHTRWAPVAGSCRTSDQSIDNQNRRGRDMSLAQTRTGWQSSSSEMICASSFRMVVFSARVPNLRRGRRRLMSSTKPVAFRKRPPFLPRCPGPSDLIRLKSWHGGAMVTTMIASPPGSTSSMMLATSSAESLVKSPRCLSQGRRSSATLRQAPSISHAKAAFNFPKCRSRM